MKIIYKEPGKEPEVRTIKNKLENLQEAVGGYIEAVNLWEDAILICNEEGKLSGLKPNIFLDSDYIAGNLFICGINGPDFCDVPRNKYEYFMEWLKERALGVLA